MSNDLKNVERPSLFLWLTEGVRAISELGWFYTSKTALMRNETGDGHPVLVLPGFMASDESTNILRGFLKEIGYEPFPWGLGTNKGGDVFLPQIAQRLQRIHEKTGQKVSLIGWSLGGVFAREIAKEHPDLVRQVITLGSPFANITAPNNATWLYNLIAEDRGVEDLDPEMLAELPRPASVPTTAIYTKEDGIVPWEVCKETELNDTRQNIQVRGSHIGLGVNPAVLHIIADRLRFKEENWERFEPKTKFKSTLLYPNY